VGAASPPALVDNEPCLASGGSKTRWAGRGGLKAPPMKCFEVEVGPGGAKGVTWDPTYPPHRGGGKGALGLERGAPVAVDAHEGVDVRGEERVLERRRVLLPAAPPAAGEGVVTGDMGRVDWKDNLEGNEATCRPRGGGGASAIFITYHISLRN